MQSNAHIDKVYKADTAVLFNGLLDHADKQRDGLSCDIAKKQQRAASLFCKQGVPYPKLERWKYSNLYPALKKMDLAPAVLSETWAGSLDYITPISSALHNDAATASKYIMQEPPKSDDIYDDNAFWYLNDATSQQGWFIDIPDNVEVSEALVLNSIGKDSEYSAQRLIIRLGRNAKLRLVENHAGEQQDASYFKNWVTQIELSDGARLEHIRHQADALSAVYVQNTHVVQGKDSAYYNLTLNSGAHISRNQIHVDLNAAGAHASLRSSAELNETQHSDMTTNICHNAPSCTSDQVTRNVLADKAVGVFQGKVYVAKGADFTDGSQSSKALLISPLASMHAKPELEIYADEVKCAHGATCGALDERALFYARSRGIAYEDARALLVTAFLNEVKDGLPFAEDM